MDGYITIGTKIDTKDFDAQIKKVEDDLKEIEYDLSQEKELKLNSRQISEYRAKAEKLKNTLVDLRKKQNDLNNADTKKFEESMNNVSKATGNAIGKIGKWALAIFSVRTAYGAVTSAMSTLTQYDNQLKTDLEYIKFSVAMGLKPVIEFIVNLAYRLLAIIRAIGIALFDFDIFSEATAKNFQKASGSAQKLKKTLAGFDEMNVLNSTSNGGGGGVAGIGKPPEIGIDEGTLSFFEKIKKAYKEMGEALANPDIFRDAFGAWGTFVEGVTRIVYGLFRTIDGIGTLIIGVVIGDTEKMKQGVQKITEGLLNVFLGKLQTMVGAFQGLIWEIGGTLNEIRNGIITAISTLNEWVRKAFLSLFEKIGTAVGNVIKNTLNKFKNFGTSIYNYVVKPVIKHFENMWTSLKKGGIKGLINYFIECWESAINWVGKNFTKMLNKLSFTNPISGEKVGVNITYKDVKLPRLAVGGIVNMPGKGVPIGGAIAGEVSKEGVIPLTDSQAMQELASTIGKFITINANITNSMNGRIISRELKRINASDNFAMNK